MKIGINLSKEMNTEMPKQKWYSRLAHAKWLMMFLLTMLMWQCEKDEIQDITKPTVVSAVPINVATGVAMNSKCSVIFSEKMDPSTITASSFTLKLGEIAVLGDVSYVGLVAIFTPNADLAANAAYTITITTGAKDLAGNALNSNFVSSFTTSAAPDITAPTVVSSVPANIATGVAFNANIVVTFSEAIDPLTITASTFTLMQGEATVLGSVTYEGLVATFTPALNLAASTVYTVMLSNGVKDLANNAMASNYTFSFATVTPIQITTQNIVSLAGVSNIAILAGSAITNTGATNITGDLALSPGSSVGGFPPGILIGTKHINDSIANQAKLDLTAAYNDAVGRTSTDIVTLSGNIGGLTLTPGLYKSTSSLAISSGDLTFDAKGDATAVFIIQIASSLTTTSGRKVILSGGASASNIFWQVGSSATFGTTSVFKGTVLAMESITFNTGATLDGRGLARIGAVTMAGNIIVKQ